MIAYIQRAEQVLRRIDTLAAISEEKEGITRTFGTQAFLDGRALVQGWMEDAGLQTRTDNIGNLRGRLACPNPAAKTLVIASHIDTVVNAGRFDGPLGVLMGLDLIENVIAAKAELPFHIELIAFSDEEGVRFHTTYLGSKVVAGTFDPALLDKQDAEGTTLRQALAEMGADPAQLLADAIPAEEWLGYFEMHIEQGPVLYERRIPVAPVTAIAGQRRCELAFTGMAGHAGTVPMDMRQDALAAASEFVLEVERFAKAHGNGLVATVGKLQVQNAASNVVPGQVTCSLDLRSPHESQLDAGYHLLKKQAEAMAGNRTVGLEWNLIQRSAPVTCDAGLTKLLTQAISDGRYEVVPLVSGAGHDAVPISAVAPVSMLFVRCFEGISHNPLESAEAADIAAAIQVSEQFLSKLISHHTQSTL